MISVCLATYNGENYVREQLCSVLLQLEPIDEVVISDDGSTDHTLAVIASFNDSRIRVLNSEGKLGVVRNFERALRAARGDLIFLCDQDDVWLPDKVERCRIGLKDFPLIVTDCSVVDGNLAILSSSFFRLRSSGPGVLHNLWKNSYLGCCMAFRRELLEIALPFPRLIPMHDMWLGMLAEIHGGTCFIPEQLLLYRRHGRNASDAGGKSKARFSKMIADRFFLGILVAGRTLWQRFT